MRPLVAGALLLLTTTLAWARPVSESEMARARDKYRQGMVHFNLQEYPQAIGAFEEAYREWPDPSFLYNLAQAHRLSGNVERALWFYRAYLRDAPRAPNRRDVAQRIAELEREQAERGRERAPVVEPSRKAAPEAEPAPARTTASAPEATTAALTTSPAPSKPVWKKGWFWGVLTVSVVAVGVGLGVGLGLGLDRGLPYYPTVRFGALQ